MIPNPKMVILDQKEYKEKYDQAIAYSEDGQLQNALNLLLVKQKRWVKFELFFAIAWLYNELDKEEEAKQILSQIIPYNYNQKQKKFRRIQ